MDVYLSFESVTDDEREEFLRELEAVLDASMDLTKRHGQHCWHGPGAARPSLPASTCGCPEGR
ncbi:MAG TPA: hypothetical protein VIX82_05010 [Solirubrobacteraceae bacterium]